MALEAHLSRCAACRRKMARARRVVAQLAYLAEDVEPPAALRRKVRAIPSKPRVV